MDPAVLAHDPENQDLEWGTFKTSSSMNNRLSRLESAILRIEGKVNAVFAATKPPPPPPNERFFGGMITHHQAWWLLIFPLNIACMAIVLTRNRSPAERSELATTLALANLVAAVAIRDGTILLFLYNVVVRIPRGKYFFNRMLHCNGGIHTGCSLMLLVWAIIAASCGQSTIDRVLLALLCSGLVVMMLLAVQPVRERHHNLFERVHRYFGWTLILFLLAILLKKFTDHRWNLSAAAIASAVFMSISLFLVFYSWFIIERQDVEIKSGKEGNIVVVRMKGKGRPGAFAKISFDLVEWHAFSVAFSDKQAASYGLIVGVAGDWTKMLASKCQTPLERIMSRASSLRRSLSRAASMKMPSRASSIRNSSMRNSSLSKIADDESHAEGISGQDLLASAAPLPPPPPPPLSDVDAAKVGGDPAVSVQTIRAFIRWHRPLGFMYSIYAYKRVICVGTGAGIAPILPHIGNNRVAIHVVWIAKKHREIYGNEICDRVLGHPHTVYDTAKQGRPKPEIALEDYEAFKPDAVFIISNAPFTEAVRDVCKARDVPAYGAVFDS